MTFSIRRASTLRLRIRCHKYTMDWTRFRRCVELASQQGVEFVVEQHNESCTDEFCELVMTSLAVAVLSMHKSVVAQNQRHPGHDIVVSWEYRNWRSWERAFISKERELKMMPFPPADIAMYAGSKQVRARSYRWRCLDLDLQEVVTLFFWSKKAGRCYDAKLYITDRGVFQATVPFEYQGLNIDTVVCQQDDRLSAVKCEACGAYKADLQQCSRCRNVRYCSKDCQNQHWPVHKNQCHPRHG